LCDSDGAAFIAYGDGGDKLAEQLEETRQTHKGGGGGGQCRKGFPDLYVAGDESVHFTYGAQIGEVYYSRYTPKLKKAFAEDRRIFDGLGKWHLSVGLSAVAASDNGKTVVAVALKTDDSKEASNSAILWSCSKDGGRTWSKPKDTGRKTHGGEGRLIPRLIAIENKFFLLYYDNAFGTGLIMAGAIISRL
jgi:Neuraminidase (sialidase)